MARTRPNLETCAKFGQHRADLRRFRPHEWEQCMQIRRLRGGWRFVRPRNLAGRAILDVPSWFRDESKMPTTPSTTCCCGESSFRIESGPIPGPPNSPRLGEGDRDSLDVCCAFGPPEAALGSSGTCAAFRGTRGERYVSVNDDRPVAPTSRYQEGFSWRRPEVSGVRRGCVSFRHWTEFSKVWSWTASQVLG